MEYAERLSVPLRWWVQGTMLVLSLWLVVIVAMPPLTAWIIAGAGFVVMALVFLAVGRARITVSSTEFAAGRARIDTRFLGSAEALDPERTRAVAGREADARAFLLLRPWLKEAVKVTLTDPADPTPYWLVNTRHPERLAAALTAALDAARHP